MAINKIETLQKHMPYKENISVILTLTQRFDILLCLFYVMNRPVGMYFNKNRTMLTCCSTTEIIF